MWDKLPRVFRIDDDADDALYHGTYLSVVVEGVSALPDWDSAEEPDDDCLGGSQFILAAATSLAEQLKRGKTFVVSIEDVIELGANVSTPWGRYVDPALSLVMTEDQIVAIFLYECHDHVAALAGWGTNWTQGAYGQHALALVRTLRLKRATNEEEVDDAPVFSPAAPDRTLIAVEAMTTKNSTAAESELGALVGLWRDAGYSARSALPWARAGLLPLHADRWSQWSVEEGIAFSLKALRPTEVLAWRQAHPTGSAFDWVREGISLESASQWLEAGFGFAETKNLLKRGITHPSFVSD